MKPELFFLSLAAALLLALGTVATSCGGGNEELTQALETLQVSELDTLVLPQEELGDDFADLEIDEDSGFVDNEEAADNTIDPDDTAEDLERTGRINGYALEYSDPTFSALEAGEGGLSVGTTVTLFEDDSGASDFFAKEVDDFQRLEGDEIEVGFILEEVETFAVDGLAGEAIGIRAQASFGDVRFYVTTVGFRLDRLVGAATITRADDSNVDSQAEEMARALEERMKGVLLGEITGTPVPIPEAEEEEAAGPPPEGVPDLAAMALSLDDLPAGVSIDHEGYVEDEDTVASYEREFDLGSVRIGTSSFIGMETDIDLYESVAKASATLTAVEAIFTSESGAEFFATTFAEGAGFEATDINLEPASIPHLGDDSFAVHATFGTAFGPFEHFFAFIRVDSTLGTLIFASLGGELNVSDAASLAEALAQRMAAN